MSWMIAQLWWIQATGQGFVKIWIVPVFTPSMWLYVWAHTCVHILQMPPRFLGQMDSPDKPAYTHTGVCARYLLYKNIGHTAVTHAHTHTRTQKCVWVCSENHKSTMTGDHDLSRADIVVIAVMLWRWCYVLQLWFLHSDRAQNRMSLLLTVTRGCAAIGQDDKKRLLLWTSSAGHWKIHTEVGVEQKCLFLTLSIYLQTPNHKQTIKRRLSVCLLRSR